ATIERHYTVFRDAMAGIGRGQPLIAYAVKANSNLSVLKTLADLGAGADTVARAPIAFRVNPDVSAGGHAKIATGKADNKFGVSMAEAERLYAKASNSAALRPVGVACHIGSQITTLQPLETAFAKMRGL